MFDKLPIYMRYIISFLIIMVNAVYSFAQQPPAAEILSSRQVTTLLTDSLKQAFNLRYPVYKIYQYSDRSGLYYCVLTESRDSISIEKDTFNRSIRAVTLKIDHGKWYKAWELNDFIVKNEYEESSIWFWSRYIEFTDFDNDALVDPVIVYGTSAMNGYGDGRIKFLVYYKGQKVVIRHQNGTLDFERETQVDKAFYTLPQALQLAVKQKMEMMMKNEQAIFPAGWQTDMKNKKTLFKQRN
jgi:hypothetical protein